MAMGDEALNCPTSGELHCRYVQPQLALSACSIYMKAIEATFESPLMHRNTMLNHFPKQAKTKPKSREQADRGLCSEVCVSDPA